MEWSHLETNILLHFPCPLPREYPLTPFPKSSNLLHLSPLSADGPASWCIKRIEATERTSHIPTATSSCLFVSVSRCAVFLLSLWMNCTPLRPGFSLGTRFCPLLPTQRILLSNPLHKCMCTCTHTHAPVSPSIRSASQDTSRLLWIHLESSRFPFKFALTPGITFLCCSCSTA